MSWIKLRRDAHPPTRTVMKHEGRVVSCLLCLGAWTSAACKTHDDAWHRANEKTISQHHHKRLAAQLNVFVCCRRRFLVTCLLATSTRCLHEACHMECMAPSSRRPVHVVGISLSLTSRHEVQLVPRRMQLQAYAHRWTNVACMTRSCLAMA
ncbi:hypothetical protein H310_09647 [Aphanomyces invadans]|uniref:Uncharacterized protein n=1 Tax=Aphanomyces invadans TaxID=157072 RepID=A0A024TTF0_9STRA|nr:hypothetical protein H310_09647 [Aphanomyces invadans]ETV97299.1 hypothetical protein H310_09647 [Aphanomyces invadans]|eukprot:XP_008874007.1 hypothetical protein H310_09647 [Aphanomyces invadans]